MFRYSLATIAFFSMAGTASAQADQAETGWGFAVGAGGLYAPAYEGDDEYRLSVLPNVEVRYGDRFFASVQNGAGYRWVNTERWRAGPIARLKFGREQDGDQPFAVSGEDTDDLQGLGDIDTTVELGGFVEYELGALTLTGEARQAFSGHEGFVADFGVRWSGRAAIAGAPIAFSAGPRIRVVDDAYTSAYFDVDPSQSAASGLPQYDAGGGLYSYGAGASAVLPLSRDRVWSLVMIASYDRFAGDAEESPLVRERGSPDQASVGVFLSRSF